MLLRISVGEDEEFGSMLPESLGRSSSVSMGFGSATWISHFQRSLLTAARPMSSRS